MVVRVDGWIDQRIQAHRGPGPWQNLGGKYAVSGTLGWGFGIIVGHDWNQAVSRGSTHVCCSAHSDAQCSPCSDR